VEEGREAPCRRHEQGKGFTLVQGTRKGREGGGKEKSGMGAFVGYGEEKRREYKPRRRMKREKRNVAVNQKTF